MTEGDTPGGDPRDGRILLGLWRVGTPTEQIAAELFAALQRVGAVPPPPGDDEPEDDLGAGPGRLEPAPPWVDVLIPGEPDLGPPGDGYRPADGRDAAPAPPDGEDDQPDGSGPSPRL